MLKRMISLAAFLLNSIVLTECGQHSSETLGHAPLLEDHSADSGVDHVAMLQDSYKMLHQEPTEPPCYGRLVDAPANGMTMCPQDLWVDSLVESDPSSDKIIIDIGCNKGDDLIAWMERWDPSPQGFWNTSRWKQYYADTLLRPDPNQKNWVLDTETFHCPDRPFSRPEAVKQMAMQSTTRRAPIAVCVEPERENIELLKASSALGYGSTEHGSFHIVQAALSDHADMNQTIEFPDGFPGQENLGLSSRMYDGHTSSVPLTTVDNLVKQLKLPRVDILTIDTEGWDPAVLLGAMETLSSVRYLEFEVHRDLKGTPWENTTLKSVITSLDEKGLECHWAGTNGVLLSLNKCWKESFEEGFWANVACVKRNDEWATALKPFHHRPGGA